MDLLANLIKMNSEFQLVENNSQKKSKKIIQSLEDLISFFGKENLEKSPFSYILSDDYKKTFNKIQSHFRFQVTSYYLSLANIYNPQCPILLQILPDPKELEDKNFFDSDPQQEEKNSPIPGLIHRYPDRVLWYISHFCSTYCRFCFRKRKVSNPTSNFFYKNYNEVIHYIRSKPNIKEVILSGGDPFSLSDQNLYKILTNLKSIPHLYSIRIHTRMITTYPFRITKKLVKILEKMYPLTIVTHFNHPLELTEIVYNKIKKLKKAGISVLNQSVLLKNINDNLETLEALNLKLIQFGIQPYYLHHCDQVQGTSHFSTSLQKDLELLKKLQSRNSGITIPKYVIDLPNGGGKIYLQNPYLISFDKGKKQYSFYNNEFDSNKIYFLKEIYD